MLETWSTIAALAEATSRIELIGAVKPLLFNPLVFAKIAANIADIADGRLAVNLVTGWFLPELEGLGLDPLDHDDRYAYSRNGSTPSPNCGRESMCRSATTAANPR